VKLTAIYGGSDRVCAWRIETPEHSERVSPNLTDARYWIDSRTIARLLADLVPESSRRGPTKRETLDLRPGEQMIAESDQAVSIVRIHRNRRLLNMPDMPAADRLVRIAWKGTDCLLE
jgi:hypothetical protein